MSALLTFPSDTPGRRVSLSRYFWPMSIAFTRSLALMTCLILLRAREVLTNASQSLLGSWPGWVMISIISPLLSVVCSGPILPVVFVPSLVMQEPEWLGEAYTLIARVVRK